MKKQFLQLPALTWLLLTILSMNATAQTAGLLDSSFATNGVAIVPIGTSHDVANDFVVLPDGKILVGGNSSDPSFEFHASLARLNEDGSLDDSFGNNGTMVLDISSQGDYIYAMQLLEDGKIIIAGGTSSGEYDFQFFAMKIDQDGNADTSFGENGVAIIPVNTDEDYAHAMAIQHDGKIVLAGQSYVPNFYLTKTALVRLTADGIIDSSFGTNGIVLKDAPFDFEDAYGVIIMDDGSIVTAGYASEGFYGDLLLYKFDTDGNSDVTFGDDGRVLLNLNAGNDTGWDIGINPFDNRLLVTGRMGDGLNSTDFMIASFKQDGTLDSTFGQSGLAILDLQSTDAALGIAFQQNGKIVITGTSGGSGLGDIDWTTCRFESNGTIDLSFGMNGWTLSPIGSFFSEAHAVKILDDGKILAVGQSSDVNNDFAIVRYTGDEVATSVETITPDNKSWVYPNPISDGKAMLQLNDFSGGQVSINLYDVQSRLIATLFTGNVSAASSDFTLQLPASIHSGYYLIKAETENMQHVCPVIIR